jgi:hypothetical protein
MKTKQAFFWTAFLGVALGSLLMAGWLAPGQAGAQPPEALTPNGAWGGFGGPGMGRPMRPPSSGALAVSGKYVYVLQGNSLFQFSAEDLTQLKKVDLPAETFPLPEAPPPPPGLEEGEEGGQP